MPRSQLERIRVRSTANTLRKTARLKARITEEQKTLIERAAVYEGKTVSDFVVSAAQEAAKAVISEHDILRLTGGQARSFVEALLSPPQPNDELQQGADIFRRDVISQ